MSNRTDWLPGTRTGQLEMAKTWVAVLAVKGQGWGIAMPEVTILGNRVKSAEEALNLGLGGNRSPAVTAEINERFRLLVDNMRMLKTMYFHVPPLTDPDLVSLGLKPRDRVRTPVPPPTAQAEADVTYPGPHVLMLHIKMLAGAILDPRADHGFRVYYGLMPPGGATREQAAGPGRLLERPPSQGAELPHSLFTRRRREIKEFTEADSGRTAFFAIRVENGKGNSGPWGPVFSAVIP